MTTKIVEVEADTLEEAREEVKSQMHKGLHVVSEDIISDGKPTTVKIVAETTQAAFAKAQDKIPNDMNIVEKKELATPGEKVITVEAFDESSARLQVEGQIGVTTVKAIKLVTAGKKGFLGIGKKPNQYEAEVTQQAAVEVTYKKPARIRAEIGVKLVSPSDIGSNDSFAQAVWDLTDGPLGTIEIEGKEVEVSLHMYGLSHLAELKKQIQVVQQSRKKIDVTNTSNQLFLGGIYAIAGHMKTAGKNFPEFKPVCRTVTEVYIKTLKPMADSLNGGIAPSEHIRFGEFPAFQIRNIPEDDLSEIRYLAKKGFSPLTEFLYEERRQLLLKQGKSPW